MLNALHILVMFFTALLIGYAAAAEPANTSRPNVLFIAIDDLRVELGCYGSTYIHSPNIDRLAAEGTRFDRAYCQAPVCGASRASLMSGLRPTRDRFNNWFSTVQEEAPDAVTLPEHLRKHGYYTVSRGKLFHDTRDMAERAWSEQPWPAAASNVKRFLKAESKAQSRRGAGTPWAERGPPVEGRDLDVPDGAYPDGELTERALADLARLAKLEQPFFLGVGFWKPHLPFTAPRKYWDLYKPNDIELAPNPSRPQHAPNAAVPVWNEVEMELRHYSGVPIHGPLPDELARELKHGYHACISYIDAQVGRLLDEVDRLGLREKTVVVLWSDHGWQLGEHGLWGKKLLFEESLRVPLIVRAPAPAPGSGPGGGPGNGAGARRGGNVAAGIVELLDIYPTLCELTATPPPPHLEGQSFAPMLRDGDAPGKDAALSRMYEGEALTTATHRYCEWRTFKAPNARDGGRVYARTLYDLLRDPAENVNIAEQSASESTVREMNTLLTQPLHKSQ